MPLTDHARAPRESPRNTTPHLPPGLSDQVRPDSPAPRRPRPPGPAKPGSPTACCSRRGHLRRAVPRTARHPVRPVARDMVRRLASVLLAALAAGGLLARLVWRPDTAEAPLERYPMWGDQSCSWYRTEQPSPARRGVQEGSI